MRKKKKGLIFNWQFLLIGLLWEHLCSSETNLRPLSLVISASRLKCLVDAKAFFVSSCWSHSLMDPELVHFQMSHCLINKSSALFQKYLLQCFNWRHSCYPSSDLLVFTYFLTFDRKLTHFDLQKLKFGLILA